MNIYFLVEGASTEVKFYPELISSIFENRLSKIKNIQDVNDLNDSFYILTANGYPQIYSHILRDTIGDINQYNNFNYLFICLDADEMSVAERTLEFEDICRNLTNEGVTINDLCEVILVVQNRCIESWFLGNKQFFRRNTANQEMLDFHFFYNVKTNDPEEMGYDDGFDNHASYHYSYLKHMIRENRRIYSKRNANVVCEQSYIAKLKERFFQDNHIGTFGYLVTKLLEINQKLLER